MKPKAKGRKKCRTEISNSETSIRKSMRPKAGSLEAQ